MEKRKLAILILLIHLLVLFVPMTVQAANTSQAGGFIDTTADCDLEIILKHGSTVLEDVSVELYQIATVSADAQYQLTSAFQESGITFSGISSQSEWDTIRSTFEAYLLAHQLQPMRTVQTDSNGLAQFEDLEPGLYFIPAIQTGKDGFRYYFASAITALPNLDSDGSWNYDVTLQPKADVDNPTGEDVQYKVVKVWKDRGNEKKRPTSIQVDLYYNNKIVRTVVLDASNNWSYSWYAEDEVGAWKVVEKKVPQGYVMRVTKRETTFTITNSIPGNSDIPQTGDSTNLLLYVFLLVFSGAALIFLALGIKRHKQ